MARIFLCHASEDKAQVRKVYRQLKALGFTPWLDEVDILGGQDWDYEINQALETSAFVIVFLSTRSVEKIGYVQREFRQALYHSEELPEGFIHTIPVKLDDCLVPRRFRRYQWIKLYEEGAFDRIVHALHHGLQQRSQPVPEPPTHDPNGLDTFNQFPKPRQEKQKTLTRRRVYVLIAIILSLLGAGYWRYQTWSPKSTRVTPSPTNNDPIQTPNPHQNVKVVFFDLGGTLVIPILTPGNPKSTLIPGGLNIIRLLQNRQIRLGIISNVGSMTRQQLLDMLPADLDRSTFEPGLIILSSEVGINKPDAAIFKLAIKKASVRSEECMYISENHVEINVAKQTGMKALRYQSFEETLLGSL